MRTVCGRLGSTRPLDRRGQILGETRRRLSPDTERRDPDRPRSRQPRGRLGRVLARSGGSIWAVGEVDDAVTESVRVRVDSRVVEVASPLYWSATTIGGAEDGVLLTSVALTASPARVCARAVSFLPGSPRSWAGRRAVAVTARPGRVRTAGPRCPCARRAKARRPDHDRRARPAKADEAWPLRPLDRPNRRAGRSLPAAAGTARRAPLAGSVAHSPLRPDPQCALTAPTRPPRRRVVRASRREVPARSSRVERSSRSRSSPERRPRA